MTAAERARLIVAFRAGVRAALAWPVRIDSDVSQVPDEDALAERFAASLSEEKQP
jgi:hypothetical protein